MTFSIVQRRTLIGTLRAIGVTRREVFLGVVVEATVIKPCSAYAGNANDRRRKTRAIRPMAILP